MHREVDSSRVPGEVLIEQCERIQGAGRDTISQLSHTIVSTSVQIPRVIEQSRRCKCICYFCIAESKRGFDSRGRDRGSYIRQHIALETTYTDSERSLRHRGISAEYSGVPCKEYLSIRLNEIMSVVSRIRHSAYSGNVGSVGALAGEC